jgi:hypothetical protein
MIFFTAFAFAQGLKVSTASFANLNNKPTSTAASAAIFDKQPAAMIVLPYTSSVVLDAMAEYEARSYGSNKKQSSAYQSFDKTALMQNNKKGAPLIFKVGPIDFRQPDQTIVYLLLDAPIENGDHAGKVNHFASEDAISYLNNLAVAIQLINLDNQIKMYTAQVRKADRQQDRCAKRCDRLGNRKENIEQKLTQNKRGVANRDRRLEARLDASQSALALQKATAEKHRTNLTSLNSQRSSLMHK